LIADAGADAVAPEAAAVAVVLVVVVVKRPWSIGHERLVGSSDSVVRQRAHDSHVVTKGGPPEVTELVKGRKTR
jgi:hypothetical protein